MPTPTPEDVLRGYFQDMHEWEDDCFFKMAICKFDKREEFWHSQVLRLTEIWNKWCLGPYPHGDRGRSAGDPTEYGDREKIESCTIVKDSAIVETSDHNMLQMPSFRTVYSFKLVENEWRIASRHEITGSGRKKKRML